MSARATLVACTALLVAAAAGTSAAQARASEEQIEHKYTFTGTEQTFVVPNGLEWIGATAVGAAGYPGHADPADVNAVLPVTPGEILYLEVPDNATANTGGAGAGGGAADIRTVSRTLAGTLSSRILVAAGSGGDGSGGALGGAAGEPGESRGGAIGGEPGSQSAGGAPGTITECVENSEASIFQPAPGELAFGGHGGDCTVKGPGAYGGGGGGGLYGGGGGGAEYIAGGNSFGAGGGGGSSLVPENGSLTLTSEHTPRIELRYLNQEVPPGVAPQPPAPLHEHLATLNGTVTPDDSPVTTCEFEYGTSVFYEHSAPCSALPGHGDQPVSVSAPIEGLDGSTTYHYRVVATNSYGTSYSSDAEFTSRAHEPPTVSEYSPHEGGVGTKVTIVGTGMEYVTSVTFFDGTFTHEGTGLTHLSPTSISVLTPNTTAAMTMTLHDEYGDETVAGRFRWVNSPSPFRISPKKGSPSGGTTVVITGTHGMDNATEVLFGTVPGTIVSRGSVTVTAISPPNTLGKYYVRVVNAGGISAPDSKVMFTYKGLTVTGVSPSSGSLAGGTRVSVKGAGFATGTGTSFLFKKTPGAEAECTSSSACTVTAPPGLKAGTVDVMAVVEGAKSKKGAADRFTYE